MKLFQKLGISFLLFIVIAIGYRFIPLSKGIYGLTPVFAIAIFGGAIFSNNKKIAFLLPVLTLFLSDVLFELLYKAGKWTYPGFYDGQLLNYFLIALTVSVGFLIRKIKVLPILFASILAPTGYYILSNFGVWAMSGIYPKNMNGLVSCYVAGWPFYFPNSIISTILYSALIFGVYKVIEQNIERKQIIA